MHKLTAECTLALKGFIIANLLLVVVKFRKFVPSRSSQKLIYVCTLLGVKPLPRLLIYCQEITGVRMFFELTDIKGESLHCKGLKEKVFP